MKLKRLVQQIDDLVIRGPKEIEITGITAHSNQVAPGDLFIAKKGLTHDGADYIPEAIAAGAVAILTDLADPFIPVTQLIHPDISSIEAKLASQFFHQPSKELKVVGVTGTNGKTTVSFLIQHLFSQSGLLAGLIGTIEWVIGSHRFSGGMTTPDVITNQKLLRDMVSEGCKAAVMEVSSHGLDQNRVGEILFDIAIFTNLSQDHLDYHRSMEQYKKAKEKLFTSLKEGKWAILNKDEDFFPQTRAKVLTYGIENGADLTASEVKIMGKGTQFSLTYQGEKVSVRSPLIGKFNVYNLLAAIGAGIAAGISLEDCAQHLRNFSAIPGRLERIKNSRGLNVFIDFAHTEDALKNVLETLRPLTKGRLITLFGCGGDRDKDKRKGMGKTASSLSDLVILTNDNPRTENPDHIIQDILKGITGDCAIRIEKDRRLAIQLAVGEATPDDLILIAGRGHEKEQIFAHQILPFEDSQVAKEILKEEVSI